MKMNLSSKTLVLFVLLSSVCTGFTIYITLTFQDAGLTTILVLFCCLVIAIFTVSVLTVKKHMLELLTQLSDMISALIDNRENEVFSVLNDDMLSKLQAQVTKLSGILKAHNTRLKNERDEIKSLISDISHQLKTPLANLKVYCDLLQDSSLAEPQREEFINNMENQLNKLSFLMDSMIKMSRLESGIIQLNPQMGSLNDTCLTAIKQVYQKAQVKNITISFSSEQDIPLTHDRNWMTEGIFNILDNAIKYTENGGMVTMSTAKYEMLARITITDTGWGMEEAEINHIFKRFYRGENARNQEGAGIGLYLTREIVTQQGGYIKVDTKKGIGSTFSLFLPLS